MFEKNKNQFNDLERAIIDWCIENSNNSSFVSQLKLARFVKRDWTKAGSYVTFEVPETVSPIDFKEFPINGPFIESDDIEFGGLTLFWGEKRGNGSYLNCIEIAAIGSFFRENIKNFKLSDIKLHS